MMISSNAYAQNLFVDSYFNGTIVEITPGGVQSTFASGLYSPTSMAFQPVPEPSAFGLLALEAAALLVRRWKLAAGKCESIKLLVV